MSSDGNVTKNTIVNNKTFGEFESTTLSRYEKTTDTQEKIDGLWLKRGSSDYQAKIWTAASKAIALATKARNYIPEVSGVSDNAYQQDGEALSAVQGSGFRAHVPLINGSAVTLGDEVEPATGGKTQKRAQGQKVGIALETVTASGADADLLIEVDLSDTKIWCEETLSAAANSVVLSNVPYLVDLVEVTTGDITGGKIKMVSGTVASGEVDVDYANSKLSFHASDAPVNVYVRYLY